MSRHTAHFVKQALKGKLKKLLTALADPTQSRKHHSKTKRTSKDVPATQTSSQDTQATETAPELAAVIVVDAPCSQDDETRQTKSEIVSQDDEHNRPGSASASVQSHSSLHLQRPVEQQPLPPAVESPCRSLQSPSSSLLHDCELTTASNITEAVKRARVDSGTVISTPDSPDIGTAAEAGTLNKAYKIETQADSITIPIESELALELASAVLEHRKLKALEHDGDLQLAALEDQGDTLSKQVEGLQDVIKGMKAGPASSGQSAEINALYDAISNLREAEENIWQRRQRLVRHMSGLYKEFRDEQCELYELLDSTFVTRRLIPRDTLSVPEDGNGSGNSSSLSMHQKLDPAHTLRRSSALINDQTKDAFDQAAAETRDRAALLDDYIAKRKKLITCEVRFEAKDDHFDTLELSRRKRLAAGEEVETPTEFDHYQYDETRQLTRNIIDAEAKCEAAKAAAVAAGVKLKFSDLESGFVDDVDDGYRVSMEKDMVEECNRAGIEDWLMEIEEKACPTRYLSVRDFPGLGDLGEEGDWICEEVDISDSRSMVAEGSERRRIDRWRSLLA